MIRYLSADAAELVAVVLKLPAHDAERVMRIVCLVRAANAGTLQHTAHMLEANPSLSAEQLRLLLEAVTAYLEASGRQH